MRWLVSAIVLMIIVAVGGWAVWPKAAANAIDRSMPNAGAAPQTLIPRIFTVGEAAADAQRQLISDGYALTTTTDITISRSTRPFGQALVGDPDWWSPPPLGKTLQFDKSGGWCRAYRVLLDVTEDGKVKFAYAISPLGTCVL